MEEEEEEEERHEVYLKVWPHLARSQSTPRPMFVLFVMRLVWPAVCLPLTCGVGGGVLATLLQTGGSEHTLNSRL